MRNKILIILIIGLILLFSNFVNALTKIDEQTIFAWETEDRSLKLILKDVDYYTSLVSFEGKLECIKVGERCSDIGVIDTFYFKNIPISGCVYATGPDYKSGYGRCEIELINIDYKDSVSYIKIKHLENNEEIILSLSIDTNIKNLYELLWKENEILNSFDKLDTYSKYVGKIVVCKKELIKLSTGEIIIKKIETIEEFKEKILFSDLIDEIELQSLFEECKINDQIFVPPVARDDFITKCILELKPILEESGIKYDENYDISMQDTVPDVEIDINYDLIIECKKREVFLDKNSEKLEDYKKSFGENIIQDILNYRNKIFPENIKKERYREEHRCSIEEEPHTNIIGRIWCRQIEDIGPKIREIAEHGGKFKIKGCENYSSIESLIDCVINLHRNQDEEIEEETVMDKDLDFIKEVEEGKTESIKEKEQVKEVKQQIGFFKKLFNWFLNLF